MAISSSDVHSKTQQIRVLIVDDMPQVRKELRLLLQLSGELEVVGEAGNGQEAIKQAERLKPDVVIMDLEMPVLDGLLATQEIKQRSLATRIVILSVHSTPANVESAKQAGADAFVQKAALI
ncbi:MAG: response regulator transcription factor [Anaerolineae bacterium]|nr:response regulator transcription factor [Anaerolineae bacterium]